MDRTPEDILDECIERLIGGEPVEALLAAYPGRAAALMPALRSARLLLSAPAARASDAARLGAMRRMLDQLEASAKPQVAGGWLGAFRRRPVAFQAAVLAGGIALFGALGVGAAAATGIAPEPVRELFRFSSSSQIRVEFNGVIAAIDADARTLDVAAGGDVRTVRVNASTELTSGGRGITLADFSPGDPVEVKGTLQSDDTILASRVHLEDDADTTATPRVDPTAGAGTPDDADDDGDNDDSSGPGSGDGDDSDPLDNSGPGNGDGIDGDSSGPGSGGDRTPQPESSATPDAGGHNSGPGGGDASPDHDDTPDPDDTPVPGG